ncbi:MAG: phage holin family protein [Burkholderiales bacterium]
MAEQSPEQPSPGLLQSLRNLGATLVAVLQTRLELLATDLEEERTRLLQILFWAAAALFFFGVAVLILALLVVLLLWEERRVGAIIGLSMIFFIIGVALAIGVRNRLRVRSRLFASNVEELARDQEELTSR